MTGSFRLTVLAVASSLALSLAAPTLAQTGPFQFHAITPCRIFDSRTDGDGATPLSNGPHSLRVQGVCGVPSGAKAAALNVTVVSPNRDGHIVLWPAGGSEPTVSTLNFLAGEPALANGAIVPLGAGAGGSDDLSYRYSMANPPGTGHIVFDVTGYFQ
jgi:hypothetical protein